jgi:hypothetical protein
VKCDGHVFRGNTLGLPKICPEENIGAIDRQTLYTYLSAFHRYMVYQISDYRSCKFNVELSQYFDSSILSLFFFYERDPLRKYLT